MPKVTCSIYSILVSSWHTRVCWYNGFLCSYQCSIAVIKLQFSPICRPLASAAWCGPHTPHYASGSRLQPSLHSTNEWYEIQRQHHQHRHEHYYSLLRVGTQTESKRETERVVESGCRKPLRAQIIAWRIKNIHSSSDITVRWNKAHKSDSNATSTWLSPMWRDDA